MAVTTYLPHYTIHTVFADGTPDIGTWQAGAFTRFPACVKRTNKLQAEERRLQFCIVYNEPHRYGSIEREVVYMTLPERMPVSMDDDLLIEELLVALQLGNAKDATDLTREVNRRGLTDRALARAAEKTAAEQRRLALRRS